MVVPNVLPHLILRLAFAASPLASCLRRFLGVVQGEPAGVVSGTYIRYELQLLPLVDGERIYRVGQRSRKTKCICYKIKLSSCALPIITNSRMIFPNWLVCDSIIRRCCSRLVLQPPLCVVTYSSFSFWCSMTTSIFTSRRQRWFKF